MKPGADTGIFKDMEGTFRAHASCSSWGDTPRKLFGTYLKWCILTQNRVNVAKWLYFSQIASKGMHRWIMTENFTLSLILLVHAYDALSVCVCNVELNIMYQKWSPRAWRVLNHSSWVKWNGILKFYWMLIKMWDIQAADYTCIL